MYILPQPKKERHNEYHFIYNKDGYNEKDKYNKFW